MPNVLNKNILIRKYFTGMNSYDNASDIHETQCALIENGLLNKAGELEQRKGLSKIAQNLNIESSSRLGILEVLLGNYLYILGGTTLYKYNSGIDSWEAIDTGFASSFQTKFIQANNKLYISNSADNVHSVDESDVVTDLGDTNTDPPKSIIYEYHDNRMFSSKDDLVYFSDIADPETWDRSLNNFKALKGSKGQVTALKSFKEKELIIYKQDTILVLDTTGASPLHDWVVRLFNPVIGCPAGRTVTDVGNDHIFLANDGIRVLSRSNFDTIQVGLISKPIQNYIDRINWNVIDVSFASFFDNKYIIGLPLDSSASVNFFAIWDSFATQEAQKRGINIQSWTVIATDSWKLDDFIISKYKTKPSLISVRYDTESSEDIPGLTFNQDFSSDIGFTYDSSKTEFVSLYTLQGGVSASNYTTGIDLSWGGGDLVGTGTGGATISSGKLDLSFDDIRYVDYNPINNLPASQKGAIRFKLTPSYTGSPASDQIFVNISKTADDTNLILIKHETTGHITCSMKDSSDVSIFTKQWDVWSPTSSTEYEIEFNYNLDDGKNRFYIDGMQIGIFDDSIGTRTIDLDIIRIGSERTGTNTSNFEIDDIVFFDEVQHTDYMYTTGYVVGDDNPLLSEIMRQKNQVPDNASCYATYTSDINLTYGNGTLTGTAFGGASILSEELDLAHNDIRYVDYDAVNNFNSPQIGAFKFKLRPNYTGSPSTNMQFVSETKGLSDNTNGILISQFPSGSIFVQLYNSAGAFVVNEIYGAWSPTANVQYEIEYNFDFTNGNQKLFIDGTQLGATKTTTFTRDLNNINLLRIGSTNSGSLVSDFKIADFIRFDNVEHVSNYTAGYTLEDTIYVSDTITYPDFSYAISGNISSFTAINTTESNSPKYILNGEYWNGSIWTASDDSYAQANSVADINSNILSLTTSSVLVMKTAWDNSISRMDVDDLTVTFTGEPYPTKIYNTLSGTSDDDIAINSKYYFRDEDIGHSDIDKRFSHIFVKLTGGSSGQANNTYFLNGEEENIFYPNIIDLSGESPVLPINLPFYLNDSTIISKQLYINNRGKTFQYRIQHNTLDSELKFLGYWLYSRIINQTQSS